MLPIWLKLCWFSVLYYKNWVRENITRGIGRIEADWIAFWKAKGQATRTHQLITDKSAVEMLISYADVKARRWGLKCIQQQMKKKVRRWFRVPLETVRTHGKRETHSKESRRTFSLKHLPRGGCPAGTCFQPHHRKNLMPLLLYE